mmetsp:Transcript_63750/g.106004  ORF Transcript_63750/g.106004 Transcript_63750/m.106004 type:complete len:328 (-) Transcript_63750:254-1237(-)
MGRIEDVVSRVARATALPCRQTFDHYRLGNIIDVWVREFVLNDAGAIGAHIAAKVKGESLQQLTERSGNTFGNFLAKNPMVTFVDAEPTGKRWNSTDHCGYWNGRHWPWWVYSLQRVAEFGAVARPALMRAFDAYFHHRDCANTRAPARRLNRLAGSALWMAVHVRTGDFVANRGNKTKWIEPKSIAAAAKAHFVQAPAWIAICGGGRNFTMSDADSVVMLAARSDRLIQHIRAAFSVAFPAARVELIDETSPDADFYLIVTAPMLVTAAGSYALAASLASQGQRLTPALRNLNFVDKGWEKTERQAVVPGEWRWRTYVGKTAYIPS